MVDASMSKWRWQVACPRNGQIYWWDYPDDVNDNLEQAYELAKHGGEGRIRWEYKLGPALAPAFNQRHHWLALPSSASTHPSI